MSDIVYFIDSENVGARWIDLMIEEPEDDFLVFYTGNSPHLDYEHTIRLMSLHKKPEFIRCYEGKNALDFQLVSYLGYYLRSDDVKEVIIMSSDVGFDSVVSFWTDRGMKIRRLDVNLTQTIKKLNGENVCSSNESIQKDNTDVNSMIFDVDVKDIYTIINCFGTSDTKYIHNAFTHFFGTKRGRDIYDYEKARKFEVPPVSWRLQTKIKKFCELIHKYANPSNVSIPEDFVSFLTPLVEIGVNPEVVKKKAIEKYGEKTVHVLGVFMPFYRSLIQIQ